MKKFKFLSLLLLAPALVLGACDNGGSSTPKEEVKITLNEESVELKVGETHQIDYTVDPETTNLSFTSADATIASVNESGLITAVKEGETTVTLAVKDYSSVAPKTLTVKVIKGGTSAEPTLNFTEKSIKVDEEFILKVNNVPDGEIPVWLLTGTSVLYTLESIVKADSAKVKGIEVGESTIRVDVGNKTLSCKITVTSDDPVGPVAPTSIKLNKNSLELKVGENETLTTDYTGEEALTWSTSDAEVATILNGKVTAVKEGEATITVKFTNYPDVKDTCAVTVSAAEPVDPGTDPEAPTSIKLNKNSLELEVDATETLTTDYTGEEALEWSSSNEDVATVDENGLVTAKAEGEATITVKFTNYPEVKDTCTVTVSAAEEEPACKVVIGEQAIALEEVTTDLFENEAKKYIVPNSAKVEVKAGDSIEVYFNGVKRTTEMNGMDDDKTVGQEKYNNYVGNLVEGFEIQADASADVIIHVWESGWVQFWITGGTSGVHTKPLAEGFYVYGTFSSWAVLAQYKMTQDAENAELYHFEGLELSATDEFLVTNETNSIWCKKDGANVCPGAAGTYNVTYDSSKPDNNSVTFAKAGEEEDPVTPPTEAFVANFEADVSSVLAWNPVPDNFSLYVELDDGTKVLGTWDEVKGNMTVEGNKASVSVNVPAGKYIKLVIIYFVQGGTTKQSNNIDCSITAAGDYVVTLGMSSWSGDVFNGATVAPKA